MADREHIRIPHRELRNNSSAVLRRVQTGEVIEVTNHGEVVAILVPPGTSTPRLPVRPATSPNSFIEIVKNLPPASNASSLEVLDELRGER